MRPALLATLALIAACGDVADATTYYMAMTGSDSAAGSRAAPWASCRPFQEAARPGDELVAKAGRYGPDACSYDDWQASGTAGRNVVFRAETNGTAIFDGEWEAGYFLQLNGDSYVTVRGLRMEHWDDRWGDGVILVYNGAHHITIEDNHFFDNGGTDENDHHIYLNGGGAACHDIVIRRNVMDTSPGGGVHGYHDPGCTRVEIVNNLFKNNYYGIVLGDGVGSTRIHHNTFIDNGRANGDGANISLDGHGSVPLRPGIDVRNNISFNGNGGIGMKIARRDADAVTEAYNLFWSTSSGSPIRYAGTRYSVANYRAASGKGQGSIQADPLLVSVGQDEVRANSPAVGAANGSPQVSRDRLNVTRPRAATRDMGSRER